MPAEQTDTLGGQSRRWQDYSGRCTGLIRGSPTFQDKSFGSKRDYGFFGADLPVEGGRPGEFQWRDASFLRALQVGDWVLLNEMNLVPQAVLEGLNAILDHRGTVFIPELGRTFSRHPNFRIFATQNPLGQGGGRKGHPKSFLNRFMKVGFFQWSRSLFLLNILR